MKQFFKNLINNNSGFSLVEAIVTVVILGAAVVPISMVFTRTIDTTMDTRKQLEANEIAQEYIEVLKSVDMSELEIIMPSGTLDSDDVNTFFDSLPPNFKAEISYGVSPGLDALATQASTAAAQNVDAIVYIGGGFNPYVLVEDAQGIEADTSYPDVSYSVPTIKRVILVEGKRTVGGGDHTIKVSYKSDSRNDPNSDFEVVSDENAVRFYLGAGDATVDADNNGVADYTNFISTEIIVDNNIPEEMFIYIYEDNSNTVQATTYIERGMVRFSRNLKEVNSGQKRIVEITVKISDSSGKELVNLITTKFDE